MTARTSLRTVDRPFVWRVTGLALVQNYVVGWRLHRPAAAAEPHASADVIVAAAQAHGGHGGTGHIGTGHVDPWVHFLRDSTLAAPVSVAVLLAVCLLTRAILRRTRVADESVQARLAFALGAAGAAALASVPSTAVHGWLFDEELAGVSVGSHYLDVALVTLRYTFAISLLFAAFLGVPWA
ncbi:hypothetical protein, partial [Jiangella anatolica]